MVSHTNSAIDMEKLASLCKRRGFIFQSSELYGGLASCWDYGPLGVEMKRNVKEAWWRATVQQRDDVVVPARRHHHVPAAGGLAGPGAVRVVPDVGN